MINNDMRQYEYYLYGDSNGYGQPQLSKEAQGVVKMAINISNQSVQDNINYSGANYVGLTFALLDDTYAIKYGDSYLKVLYVNPKGRLKQVYLAKI